MTKQSYAMPQLTVYGTVKELTQESVKDFGSPSDGFYIANRPLNCTGCSGIQP